MKYFIWVVVLASSVLAGCSGQEGASSPEQKGEGRQASSGENQAESPPDSQEASVQSPQEKTTKSSQDQKVSLRILNWEETLNLVAEHEGKVVVLDAWSTTCLPCMREFPNLVELHEKYGEKVACISMSCDYIGLPDKPPEAYRDKVLAFLKKQGAEFTNVLSSVESDVLFDKMELASIPAVYVFDQKGKLRKRFDNDEGEYGEEGFTYEDNVIPLVEQLLNEPKNTE